MKSLNYDGQTTGPLITFHDSVWRGAGLETISGDAQT